MAKKGGVQQLQAEINNDEDFHSFLEKDQGLLGELLCEMRGMFEKVRLCKRNLD